MNTCIFAILSLAKNLATKCGKTMNIWLFNYLPNTKGATVVIPKQHLSSYAFAQPDQVLEKLIVATKKVALILDSVLDGVGRTGMFLEGYEIDHLHSKLSPMHGTGSGSEFHHIEPTFGPFIEKYEGYLSSHDCERADDSELAVLAKLLQDHVPRFSC